MATREPSRLAAVVQRRIRELRLARGLKQEELCERAGISADAITRIEGGSRVPTLDTLERLAAALGVLPAAFFDGTAPLVERVASVPMTRVVTLLETQPDTVLAIAENVVTAVVRAYGAGTAQPRTSASGTSKPAPSTSTKRTRRTKGPRDSRRR
jgi:transcriptional regulator with XRE-family HTH domain